VGLRHPLNRLEEKISEGIRRPRRSNKGRSMPLARCFRRSSPDKRLDPKIFPSPIFPSYHHLPLVACYSIFRIFLAHPLHACSTFNLTPSTSPISIPHHRPTVSLNLCIVLFFLFLHQRKLNTLTHNPLNLFPLQPTSLTAHHHQPPLPSPLHHYRLCIVFTLLFINAISNRSRSRRPGTPQPPTPLPAFIVQLYSSLSPQTLCYLIWQCDHACRRTQSIIVFFSFLPSM
jgi:hypothetical protein